MKGSSIFKLREDIRYRVVDNEMVLFCQDDSEIVVVNELGSRTLELLREGLPLPRVVDVLLEEYNVQKEEVESDVNQFVADLRDSGIIVDAGKG